MDTSLSSDKRYTPCICPGCGWVAPRRPAEEDENNAAEAFCNVCGYDCDNRPPWRLPSIADVLSGQAGQFDDVDLNAFVPALMKSALQAAMPEGYEMCFRKVGGVYFWQCGPLHEGFDRSPTVVVRRAWEHKTSDPCQRDAVLGKLLMERNEQAERVSELEAKLAALGHCEVRR